MLHSVMRDALPAALAVYGATAALGMTATLGASADGSQAVGTVVTFTAASPDAPGGNLWYRFRVRRPGGAYQVIRDYGPANTLDWTAVAHDGSYEVEVSVRDLDSGVESSAATVVQFRSRVANGQPVVSPTSNSLVFLYSAPPCARGSRMRVLFQRAGGDVQQTPFEACSGVASMNFYLAGMRAGTDYTAHHVIDTGSSFAEGPAVTFTTGSLPPNLYSDKILIPSAPGSSNPILLGGPLGDSPVANDLDGNVVWYGPAGMTFLTRAVAGGEFWGIVEAQGKDQSQQVVRKFDLVGMTLAETNAARVSEQLRALGKSPITAFHHEARPIADGRVAILAGVERILAGVQGD